MNKLYIKVIDGVVIDHPMLIDSVKVIYPDFNEDNLPESIKEFVGSDNMPITTGFQQAEFSYIFDDNIVTRAWNVRDKTEEEKQEYIDSLGELPSGISIDPITGNFIDTNKYEVPETPAENLNKDD